MNIVNNINKNFVLLEKNIKQNLDKYKGALEIPLLAKRFDEVVIGKNKDNNFRQVITTFRNDNDIVLRRVFSTSKDNIDKQKDYKFTPYFCKTKDVKTVGWTVVTNEIKQLKGKSSLEFVKTAVKKIFLSRDNNKNILTISDVKMKDGISGLQEHSIIQFPIIDKLLQKIDKSTSKKYLKFTVNGNSSEVLNVNKSSDVLYSPQRDRFASVRFLDKDSFKLKLTEIFLEKRNLSKLGIKIEPNADLKEDVLGKFEVCYGIGDAFVRFNKNDSMIPQTDIVDVVAHETQHAYQLALVGRTPFVANGEFFNNCKRVFGPITHNEVDETKKCLDAVRSYVNLEKNMEAYLNNYLEVDAQKEGLIAKKAYRAGGSELFKEFRYIHKDMV